MRTLYLHIGQNKTGTSFIQSALANSPDILAAAGLRFPASEAKAARLCRGEPISGNYGDVYEAMDQGAAAPPGDLVFSSEYLCRDLARPEFRARLQDFLDQGGFGRLCVLLLLRDPVSMASSSYQQQVKAGGLGLSLDEFAGTWDQLWLVEPALDFLDTLPCAEVSVHNYAMVKDRLLALVEGWLGLPGALHLRPVSGRVNRSLAPAELELQRQINLRITSESDVQWARQFSAELVRRLPDLPCRPGRPSLEVQLALWERLGPVIGRINARVPEAARYLRERDIGAAAPADTQLSDEQLAVLAGILVDVQRRMEEEKQKALKAREAAKRLRETLDRRNRQRDTLREKLARRSEAAPGHPVEGEAEVPSPTILRH